MFDKRHPSVFKEIETAKKYSRWGLFMAIFGFCFNFVMAVIVMFILFSQTARADEGYLFPLANPVYVHGKILCTAWYSKWRSEPGKKPYQYKGFNYPAEYGKPIRAPFNGVVEATNIGGFEGGSITIRANDGITTVRICHVSNFEVLKYTVIQDNLTGRRWKEQTRVRRGDVIGYVGTSGRTTGPHIRVIFERNGERFFVNAATWGMKVNDFYYSPTEFDASQTRYYAECK